MSSVESLRLTELLQSLRHAELTSVLDVACGDYPQGKEFVKIPCFLLCLLSEITVRAQVIH